MGIKRSQSASRVLAVLEKVAECQPVGTSELARLLSEDKSAVQRALMTLADEDWIRVAPGKQTRWEVTGRIHTVSQIAHLAGGSQDLRERARPALQALREETGESVILNVPERGQFVVCEVLESRQYLRIVPAVGMVVQARGSATGRALLPYMSEQVQLEFLGAVPDAAMRKEFAATVARGYSISSGELAEGSTNLAAPIFEADGRPVGVVLVSAPSDRLTPDQYPRIGALVVATARKLSRGLAPKVSFNSAKGKAASE
jgi:IclR family acetate operon transcriptional repressor